jgi:hypothetical protein
MHSCYNYVIYREKQTYTKNVFLFPVRVKQLNNRLFNCLTRTIMILIAYPYEGRLGVIHTSWFWVNTIDMLVKLASYHYMIHHIVYLTLERYNTAQLVSFYLSSNLIFYALP